MSKVSRLLVVAVIVATTAVAQEGGVLEPTPAEAVHSGTNHLYMTFNMCGSACNAGGDAVADAVVSTILGRRPALVALQETCRTQAERIRNRLAASTFPMDMLYEPTLLADTNGDNNKCRFNDYGIAVLSKGGRVGTEVVELPNPSYDEYVYEVRKLLCVRTALSPSVTVDACSTHLVPRNTTDNTEWNLRQYTAVADWVNPKARAGIAAVPSGDFNRPPDTTGKMWYGTYGGTGEFCEVDYPQNESTSVGGKVDYVFVNRQRFHDVNSGDATYSDYSDHDPLYGRGYVGTQIRSGVCDYL